MFGINPVAMLRGELKKRGIDVFPALDQAEAGLEALAGFLQSFDNAELIQLLQAANHLRQPERQWPLDAIKELAAKIQLIPTGLMAAKAALDSFEQELKGK